MDFNQRIEASEDGEKVHLYATVIIPPAGPGSSGVSTVSGETRASAGGDEGAALQVQGYRPVAGLGYYKFHALPLTWYGALKTCYTEAAQLAVIGSEAEAAALRRLFQEHPSVPGAHYDYAAFMGASDLEHEGVYVTVDDVPLQDAGYLRWQDGQPNNYGRGDSPGQDCIAMTRQAEYFDVECYIKLPFICERRLDG
ncbi:hemolymph lipopolysaccharide-binding protein-like [Bacillus rossius redtenbacheri]|uniref:hemolymph lipopolysaccharide-binding protein-like n=1 Tax=Bacillus rossius redtenbacheri TaxID=93214 RepID=UPI002FDD8D9D